MSIYFLGFERRIQLQIRGETLFKLSELVKNGASLGASAIDEAKWLQRFLDRQLPNVWICGHRYYHGTAMKKIDPARFEKLKEEIFHFLCWHGEAVKIGGRHYFVRDIELKARNQGNRLLVDE